MDVRPASIRAIQASAHSSETARGSSSASARRPLAEAKRPVEIPSPVDRAGTASREDSLSSLGSPVISAGLSPRNRSPPPSGDSTPSTRTTTPSLQLARNISADTQGSGASGESSAGKMDPDWYLTLLGEGTEAMSLFCESDRDLQKALGDIKGMLQNKDDWEMRFTALGKVQGLVVDLPSSGLSPDAIAAAIRTTIPEEVCTSSSAS